MTEQLAVETERAVSRAKRQRDQRSRKTEKPAEKKDSQQRPAE